MPMQQQEVLQHELLPFPSKPMVSDPASGKYYRCLVLRADHHQQQVLLQWEYVHNSSSFWLPLSSQRIWRGSYLAKVWNCCGEGAWVPTPAAFTAQQRLSWLRAAATTGNITALSEQHAAQIVEDLRQLRDTTSYSNITKRTRPPAVSGPTFSFLQQHSCSRGLLHWLRQLGVDPNAPAAAAAAMTHTPAKKPGKLRLLQPHNQMQTHQHSRSSKNSAVAAAAATGETHETPAAGSQCKRARSKATGTMPETGAALCAGGTSAAAAPAAAAATQSVFSTAVDGPSSITAASSAARQSTGAAPRALLHPTPGVQPAAASPARGGTMEATGALAAAVGYQGVEGPVGCTSWQGSEWQYLHGGVSLAVGALCALHNSLLNPWLAEQLQLDTKGLYTSWKSVYRGVTRDPNKCGWLATFRRPGMSNGQLLGVFDTQHSAAMAVDLASLVLLGRETAVLNFPDSSYNWRLVWEFKDAMADMGWV